MARALNDVDASKKDIGGTVSGLLQHREHDVKLNRQYAVELLRSRIAINNSIGTKGRLLEQSEVDSIRYYLTKINVLQPGRLVTVSRRNNKEEKAFKETSLFTIAGLRSSQLLAAMHTVTQNPDLLVTPKLNIELEKHIWASLSGPLLEEHVMVEFTHSAPEGVDVFKLKFNQGRGEFDIVTVDKRENLPLVTLYEVKHSGKAKTEHAKNLLKNDLIEFVANQYGNILGRYVLYTGDDEAYGEIEYNSIDNFLMNIETIFLSNDSDKDMHIRQR